MPDLVSRHGGQRRLTIITGGQSGVDRAALDFARDVGLDTAGWIPRGRLAEDGPVADTYTGFVETHTADPIDRTQRNVRDADATLIISRGSLGGGSFVALQEAQRLEKPLLRVNLRQLNVPSAAERIRAWLDKHQPRTLNVAGPRASEDPEIYDVVRRVLCLTWRTPHLRSGS